MALISDSEIRTAMKVLYAERKLAVEPGGTAALAGVLDPFKDHLVGPRTCVVFCGANIDPPTLAHHLASSG